MKKLIILFILAVFANMTFAGGQNNEMSKKEKKEIEAKKEYQLTKQMLENKNFVLESDFLQDRYGNRAFVNSTINFVAVDSAVAVIQIGSDRRIGPNGVGGVTAKGRISNWELKEDKKRNFMLSMNVMTTIGIYDLHFSISPSGRATARLTGLRAGNLTFDGYLVPIEESKVYEGRSI
jgi:ribosomal protein L9